MLLVTHMKSTHPRTLFQVLKAALQHLPPVSRLPLLLAHISDQPCPHPLVPYTRAEPLRTPHVIPGWVTLGKGTYSISGRHPNGHPTRPLVYPQTIVIIHPFTVLESCKLCCLPGVTSAHPPAPPPTLRHSLTELKTELLSPTSSSHVQSWIGTVGFVLGPQCNQPDWKGCIEVNQTIA